MRNTTCSVYLTPGHTTYSVEHMYTTVHPRLLYACTLTRPAATVRMYTIATLDA